MNLRKRISKLEDDGKNVYVTHRSLITFEGYKANEAVANFWIGMCAFAVLATALVWFGSSVYFSNQAKNNPEAIKAQTEKQRAKDEAKQKAKQQYIDGCKATGMVAKDMSDERNFWECTTK